MEENDDIIVLEDENGEQLEFEYLSHLDFEGQKYIVLCPKDDENDEDDDEIDEDDEEVRVVILKIFLDENSQEMYEPLEEEEAERVFEEFLRIQDSQEN